MDEIRAELYEKIKAAGKDNEITLNFKFLNTDELRVVNALNVMETFQTIPQATCEIKNAKASIDLRNEANRIFISSKNDADKLIKAWELYSRSIATAPNTSQELSLAYANRSALLLNLHKYTECIEDINRAIELDYPNHLRGKILYRKIECLKVLNNLDKAQDCIEEARCWLQNIDLNNDEKEKFEDKMKFIECLSFPLLPENQKIKEFPTLIPNKKISCASEALTIKYDEIFGRHIVTTRKVNPGEILVIEQPYATFLMPEEAYTHCSHCLQVSWAMIPCEVCVYSMYCTQKCKSEAWKQYHDIECSITGYLVDLGYNKCSLFSTRLAILAMREYGSIEKLRKDLHEAEKCEDPLNKGFVDGFYRSDKYSSIYTLVTNADKRSVADLFERALNAAFVLYYLCVYTTLFGKKFNSDLQAICSNEDATYIGGLILRHMQIIPSNIHSVFLYFNYEEERRIDTVDIGASALPFCSLINHSCDPNVSRVSTKNHMVVFALVPIEKGGQIFDNYGSHYAIMVKKDRKEKLKQFQFKCECIACTENWPTYNHIPSFQESLADREVKRKIERALEKFNLYINCATENKIDQEPYIVMDLTRMIEILIKYVSLPCREVNNVVETLKRVLALKYGNKFEIPKSGH